MVNLSWSASGTATSYDVKRSTTAGGPYSNVATGVTTTAYSDNSVTNGTRYYYVVVAVNPGGFSGYSNEASATPNPPTNSASAVFLNLDTTTHGSWKNVYGADGYVIAQLSGGTSLPGYVQWSITGNSNYTWSALTTDVRALQKVATSDRIAACWYGGTFTASLNLTDGQAHRVALYVLDWDSTTRAERIDIIDAATSQVLNSQTVSGFNGGKWLVWSIAGNVKIKVTYTGGANGVLGGIFLDTPGGAPPPPPAAPTNLMATAGNAQVFLSWSGSTGATSYTVKRSTTAGGQYANVMSGLTGTTFSDTGLTNGTTYYYVVTATGTGGESGNSNEASATPAPPPPAAPTNLIATAGDAQVGLTWTASTGATSYNIKRSTTAGGQYTTVKTGQTTTSYTDTGLANGTRYYYVVTAVNLGGESGNSNEASATPLPPAPAAPTNLIATPGNGQVALSWGASTGAASYNVKRSATKGGPYTSVMTGVTTNSYIDMGVTNGTQYYYVVTAVNLGGESANSNEASATPSAPGGGTSAVFLNLDFTTQGSWKGVYGSEGYAIAQLSGGTSLPAYAQWSVTSSNYTWSASTTIVRALQKVATSDRIAACWYGGTFTASLNLTDGQAHQVALYVLDWDSSSRAEGST